ncbi:MAG: NADH-quinone oxidoreductase subunit NuoE [Gammaproteobacteria bacterium]|nr:NADH-quinone oxidoreductase subunit NuoE [Gammaproteobacteria bacterium]|tara:strand:+ start:2613 stop:3128 length:516 start_codon:yes stop_codon:yes gene_type:complete
MSENLIATTAIKARQLSEEEIKEIEHELELYPDKQAVGLEALKIVQKHQGWVSDESLLAISKYLDLPVADLESVATFFNLVYRQPVGKNVILFCNSVSCWIMGCDEMRTHINDKLGVDFGGTTEDGRFTFLPVPCLGDCDRAPVMMVGDDLHRNLTPEKINQIISDYQGKA